MTTAAAIYVRISDDPQQKGAGVERQRQDCAARAKALGWSVGEVYVDNDVSAYQRGAVRPGWQAMLADLGSGKRDALVVYDLDRVARQPRDLEDLLDVVDAKGVPSAVVTGDIDLGTSSGRFVARLLVNVANKASADTARRVSRQRLQAATEGRPRSNAQRQYGYDRAVQVIPAEAKVVREMFDRAIAGEGFQSIASDLNSRGVLSSTGKAWQPSSIRDILRSPMRAGLSAVKGEIVGKGQWEAIVDEDTWRAAQAALDTRRQQPGHNTRKHLLSGFLVCSLCGSRMVAGHDSYVCRKGTGGCGRLSRQRKTVDEAVTRAVLAFYEQAALSTTIEHPDLLPDIARAQEKIAAVQAAFDADVLTLADYVASMKAARASLDALNSERGTQARQAVREAASVDPVAKWQGANLSQRRQMVGNVIDTVVISPQGRGRPVDYSKIQVVWRVS